MPDFSADWELVSRRLPTPQRRPFAMLRRCFSFGAPDKTPTVTWTLRHRPTGLVRRLTARTELEAGVKLANGLFDTA
jgi:hypothetical protein